MVVDLVFGEGTYIGRSEWDRISEPIEAVLDGFAPKDVPPSRLEWVTRRADVFPTLTAMYLQAHRLSGGRTVKAQTCYACLRHGLPADLPGLLRAGRAAWEDALRTGWEQRIIPLPGDGSSGAQDDEVDDELAALDELVVDNALYDSATGVNRRKILDTSGLDENDQRTFTELWLAHDGTLAQFWAAATTALGSGKVADLQFTLQATNLVGNHLETLSQLQVERDAENISTVRDLAAWDQSAWEDFLDGEGPGQPVEPPDEITGANLSERRQKYAHALRRLVEDAYPTDVLRHRLAAESSPPVHTTELVGFFTNNPDFDITTTNIWLWVDSNPGAFSYATDPTQARADLETVQRVYQITPRLGRYETTKALLENGITSAADVANYTRDEFREAFTSVLPSEHHDPEKLAEEIWDNAMHTHASAVAMASAHAFATSGVSLVPIENPRTPVFLELGNGLGVLEEILGSLDYCACKHCRSVFSPAAYLADLLKFLDDRKAQAPFEDALAVLRERRPDIEHILLDCENTNTVLPQIDLAIELLERKFAETLDGSSPQTTWSAELLATHPEHLEAGVYDGSLPNAGTKITEYVHPWVLPFSLPFVEIRTYLEHLGVTVAELMTAFDDDGGNPSHEAIAAQILGLNDDEWSIIAGTWNNNASTDDREFWGFAVGQNDWVDILSGADETQGDPGELVRRGQYQLDELIELLDLTYIDPANYTTGEKIEFLWSETCALADAQILNLDAGALDRLHRFTRLQRKTQLPARTLNMLIEQVGGGTLDEPFLRELSAIIDLQARTRLDYEELATWWSDRIDAQAYASGKSSLYHRRFLAPELQASEDFQPSSAYGLALVGDADEELSEAELAVVLAATRLSASDYATLVATTNQYLLTPADVGKFRFRFFAELMRASSFMRGFKVSAKELVILAGLLADMNLNLFQSPTHILNFGRAFERVRQASVSLVELAWLLRHDFADEFAADEKAVARVFAELVRGLRTIAAETAELSDPDGQATRLHLATVVGDEAELDTVMAFLANSDPELDEEAQEGLINDHFGSFTDTAAAKLALVTPGAELGSQESDAPARFAWVLSQFVANLRRKTLLEDLVARELKIDAPAAGALLFDVLTDPDLPPNEGPPLAEVFLVDFASESEIADGLTSTTHPEQFTAWTRLRKAATVVRALKIDAGQLAWYSNHPGWVNLDSLPLAPTDDPVFLVSWYHLLLAMDARKLFATPDGHERLETASDLAGAVAVLTEANEWDAGEIEELLDTAYLNWPTPAVLANPERLVQLRDINALAARMGVSVLRLWSWVLGTKTPFELASEIKAAARARHDEAAWLALAPKLRDGIRVAQRDALVAANLAADPSLANQDALSQHLLIDVAMNPCMKTSRIVQAISAVQLFIHRVFLRLEPDVAFNEEAAELWTWMKNYRVWEANRKVFLYPENWIQPELRSDKTPEFIALESALKQDTLDEYRVERALSGYLESLDTVSNLEIVGVWSDLTDRFAEPPAQDIWLLGRTQNAPHEYYIRQRASGRKWRSWEKIPLNIEGDNVALVRHNSRLFLFWLVLHDATSTPGQDDSKFDAKHLSIAWSERTQEGWSRVSMSERSQALKNLEDEDRYRLQFWNSDNGVRLVAVRQGGAVVQPLATFDYDAASKHIIYEGAYPDPNKPGNKDYLDQQGNLQNKKVIALQGTCEITGQKYTKKRVLRVGAPTGVFFTQGSFEARVFEKFAEHGPYSLVHQADLWDPAKNTMYRYCPVIYDDRRRKYLLEPTKQPAHLGSEGDDLSPSKFGVIDIDGYLTCEPPLPVPGLETGPDRPRAQKLRDQVNERSAFSGSGVPGQEAAIAEIHGGNAMVIANGYEEVMLHNAMNTQNGDINFANTDDSPDVFWLKMEPLHHPYVHDLIHHLSRWGLPGLYDTKAKPEFKRQLATATPLDESGLHVVPEIVWGGDPPIDEFDFEFGSTYGVYNWEIFFHAPTLIAKKLTTDQRFEEAQNWLHRIFDPIRVVEGEAGPEKFWRIKPFYEQATELATDQLEAMLGIGVTPQQQQAAIEAFEKQVDEWLENPFDPHAVARVRPGVYQRALLMQYFDNLIAWADNLFRRDTRESINEATMLYMLVAQLLGERPNEVPGPDNPAKSYDQLANEGGGFDSFTNVAITLENWVTRSTRNARLLDCVDRGHPGMRRYSVLVRFWYFCYPPNPELLKYWDIVEDRLWKIRNCRNIDGVFRDLALFQPPIDPALLVQAAAAGLDIASVLAELDSGLPPYRFRYVWGRAQTITGELRSLGGALLSALEKRDAEELANLRAGHEVSLLESVREVRVQRIREGEVALDALRASRTVVDHRKKHYEGLVENGLLGGEQDNLDRLEKARIFQIAAQVHGGIAAVVSAIPNLMIGTGAFADWGGMHLGGAISASGAMFGAMATEYTHQASKALTNAQYERRTQDWTFQAASADKELARIDKDIAAAEIRLAIARRELADHDLQVANARDVASYMQDKYTSQELYEWMLGELATLYFQTYQLAFDLARRAERAYRHELAISDQSQPIIKYGYWDSLHKGLLAGERLGHDLARLDIAYMDRDVREYELRKSVSLAQIAPEQLLALQETGECDIDIPELLFDLDHPGHYLRRTRAVRLTIPAVVGPYTTLGATLQLVSHVTRTKPQVSSGYAEDDQNPDDRFVHSYAAGQAIATSNAVADAGVFNLDFKDERYLPFEYTGAVSSWKLRLPDADKAPQFDYRTISDVVVHLDYTAREGGDALRTAALDEAESLLEDAAADGGYQVFVVHDAFPNEWEKFLSPGDSETTHALTLPIDPTHFPYFAQRKGFGIDSVDVHLVLEPTVDGTVTGTVVDFFDDADPEADPPVTPASESFGTGTYGNTISVSFDSLTASAQPWRLEIDTTSTTIPLGLDPDETGMLDRTVIAGMVVIVHYSLTPSN
ncbi:MAG: neuraminidase-like domain-containing protein [Enhygromyxa sp.]